MSDHDMHEIRTGMGIAGMDIADAIDEEFLDLLVEAQPMVGRAVRILMDHDIKKDSIVAIMVGLAVRAVQNELGDTTGP